MLEIYLSAPSQETPWKLKTPICSFDAKTGILCPKCEGKMKSGSLTEADVEVSMKLAKMAEVPPELDKVTLLQAFEVDGDYALILGVGNLSAIRSNPESMGKIEEQLGRKVWLIKKEASSRKMLEDLFYPIKILTVNTVWLPDGSKLTKVIVPRRISERLQLNVEQIKKIVKQVRGIDLLVEFERQ